MLLSSSSLKAKLLKKLKETQLRYSESKLNLKTSSTLLPSSKPNFKKAKTKLSSKKTENKRLEENNEHQKVLTPLQQAMTLKLQGAQFRWLNEQLYTLDSTSALDLIQRHPELYDIYHQGFRDRSQAWPVHPLSWVLPALYRTPSNTVIADMGCGDAQIAETLIPKGYTVHSYDLIAKHPFVTQASMTQIPLPDCICDDVVYCLSLMNTDYANAIFEGARILKQGGNMHVVEVISRISDLHEWIQSFENIGLKLTKKKNRSPNICILNI